MGPEFTGERITPDILTASPKACLDRGFLFWAGAVFLREQHLARYRFVSSVAEIAGKRILDVACGIGYGVNFLNHSSNLVVGVDIDSESLVYAQGAYNTKGARFVRANAENLPFAQDFDLAVSMETIEHLANPAAFLDSVARVLRPDGTLIISTPNRVVANPNITLADRPKNRFHQREYSKREFYSLLRRYFEEINFYGQCLNEVAIRKMPSPIRKIRRLINLTRMERMVKLVPLEDGDEPAILIAVCRGRKS